MAADNRTTQQKQLDGVLIFFGLKDSPAITEEELRDRQETEEMDNWFAKFILGVVAVVTLIAWAAGWIQ